MLWTFLTTWVGEANTEGTAGPPRQNNQADCLPSHQNETWPGGRIRLFEMMSALLLLQDLTGKCWYEVWFNTFWISSFWVFSHWYVLSGQFMTPRINVLRAQSLTAIHQLTVEVQCLVLIKDGLPWFSLQKRDWFYIYFFFLFLVFFFSTVIIKLFSIWILPWSQFIIRDS